MNQNKLGLTSAQVLAEEKKGNINKNSVSTSRTYWDIIRENVFNLINIILFSLTAVLVGVGRISDAFIYIGVVIFNVIIGVFQEMLAKQKLDQIALLSRPHVMVVRDGVEQEIAQYKVVLGDILVLKPGDQAVVDGIVKQGNGLCDESLLTGESVPIAKREDDEILSGSFVTSGSIYYEATKVGSESYANKLTTQAKAFRKQLTPLQTEINNAIKILLILVSLLAIVIFIQYAQQGVPFSSSVQVLALIFGLIPNSLFAMITLAYALGAMRIAQKQALVQQLNAVESLSNVNTLCLDKTGTLTTNRLEFSHIVPATEQDDTVLLDLLANYTTNTTVPNSTSKAILEGVQKKQLDTGSDTSQKSGALDHNLVGEIEFSSARKLSAQLVSSKKETDTVNAYILGAPEMMSQYCTEFSDVIQNALKEGQTKGLRVLLFAEKKATTKTEQDAFLRDGTCPNNCVPVALVFLKDELRTDVASTLQHFQQLDIQVKIISGDNPQTVQSLVRQLGIDVDDEHVVSGIDLASMDEHQWLPIVQKTAVFGRITPQQKEQIVRMLKKSGRYVAMVGDGVNDILSIKQAHVGIAMQNGSAATRAVADIILLNNSFSSLPFGFQEGQRIVSGLHTASKLFLSRVSSMLIFITAIQLLALPFAFSVKQGSLISLLITGIPSIGLTLWAKPQIFPSGKSFLSSMLRFSAPAAALTFLFALPLYQFFLARLTLLEAKTAITSFIIFCGLCLAAFALPPHKWFLVHQHTYVDKKPAIMAFVLGLVYIGIICISPIAQFWELSPLPVADIGVIVASGFVWLVLLIGFWRVKKVDTFNT